MKTLYLWKVTHIAKLGTAYFHVATEVDFIGAALALAMRMDIFQSSPRISNIEFAGAANYEPPEK